MLNPLLVKFNSIQFINTFIKYLHYILLGENTIIKKKRKREIKNFFESVRWSGELSFRDNQNVLLA